MMLVKSQGNKIKWTYLRKQELEACASESIAERQIGACGRDAAQALPMSKLLVSAQHNRKVGTHSWN